MPKRQDTSSPLSVLPMSFVVLISAVNTRNQAWLRQDLLDPSASLDAAGRARAEHRRHAIKDRLSTVFGLGRAMVRCSGVLVLRT